MHITTILELANTIQISKFVRMQLHFLLVRLLPEILAERNLFKKSVKILM